VRRDEGCHRYHFEAIVDGEVHRFPEDGQYGWGDCAFDDVEAGWFESRSDARGLAFQEVVTDRSDFLDGGVGEALNSGCERMDGGARISGFLLPFGWFTARRARRSAGRGR
jgi:hypothetical protein